MFNGSFILVFRTFIVMGLISESIEAGKQREV